MKQFNITFLLVVLMSMVAGKVFAYDIAVENEDGVTIYYNYINEGKELEVTTINGYSGSGYKYVTKLNIPATVIYMGHSRNVTSIGERAFWCSGLTSVTIPNSVTSIEILAFWHCSGLASVTIPNSVTSIEKEAFGYCENLEKVIVNDISAWYKIDFGDSDSNPLRYAHHLYSDENTEIKNLVIPDDVTSIGDYAFTGCSGLTSVTIPNSVMSIGNHAFLACSGLTSVTIPNSVTSIGWYAFAGCSGLTSVTIPNSVTSISGAFAGCSGLTSVTIPNSLTNIGEDAFESCSGLTSVTIPNSLTNIGEDAFYRCSGLTSVTIPNSVTSIGECAFQDCSGLTSVTIPNSVASIGEYAFDFTNANEMVNIYSYILKPTSKTGSSFSSEIYNKATLYVPEGTLAKYKAAGGWKKFTWIEEFDPSTLSVERVEKSEGNDEEARYALDGTRLPAPQKGINIVKMSDGTTRKVIVK